MIDDKVIEKVSKSKSFEATSVVTDESVITIPSDKVVKITALMTPTAAEALLEMTDASIQRKLTPSSVRQYRQLILDGEFLYNHEPIIQDWDGNIINGRHRLTACVQAGIPIVVDMVKGANPAIMSSLDDGKVRSKADIVSMTVDGISYHNSVAKAINFIKQYKGNRTLAVGGNRSRKPFTNLQLKKFIDANQEVTFDIYECAKEIHNGTHLVGRGELTGFYYILRKVNPEMAKRYVIDGIVNGVGIEDDSPIAYVRQKLLEVKMSRAKSLTMRDKMVLLIKGWNDFIGNDGKMSTASYKTSAKVVPKIFGYDDSLLEEVS